MEFLQKYILIPREEGKTKWSMPLVAVFLAYVLVELFGWLFLAAEGQALWPLLFGILWAVLITFVKHNSKMSADTIISVFSSTSIALGLVVLSRGGAFAKYSSVLVGDVLSVTQGDLLDFA